MNVYTMVYTLAQWHMALLLLSLVSVVNYHHHHRHRLCSAFSMSCKWPTSAAMIILFGVYNSVCLICFGKVKMNVLEFSSRLTFIHENHRKRAKRRELDIFVN